MLRSKQRKKERAISNLSKKVESSLSSSSDDVDFYRLLVSQLCPVRHYVSGSLIVFFFFQIIFRNHRGFFITWNVDMLHICATLKQKD